MNADNLTIMNGRLARDVELSYSQSGKAVAKLTVVTNRAYKNQQGEREADFHNCVSFGKQAEIIANYFKKGHMIGVVGEYQDNNYTKQDGTKVYGKQLVIDSFGFRDNRQNENQQSNQNSEPTWPPNNQQNNQSNYQQDSMPGMDSRGFNRDADPFGSASQINIQDDSLPF